MTGPILYVEMSALKILYLTPFLCWVKELSERSEAKWKKKGSSKGESRDLKLASRPSIRGWGVLAFFLCGKASIFGLQKRLIC